MITGQLYQHATRSSRHLTDRHIDRLWARVLSSPRDYTLSLDQFSNVRIYSNPARTSVTVNGASLFFAPLFDRIQGYEATA